jgi:hypothetical protein
MALVANTAQLLGQADGAAAVGVLLLTMGLLRIRSKYCHYIGDLPRAKRRTLPERLAWRAECTMTRHQLHEQTQGYLL